MRCSDGDARPRHQGISHHSRTVLDAVRSEVDVALPPGVEPRGDRHRWHAIDPGVVGDVLDAAGLVVTTMGRSPDQDPLFFRAAAAAGHLAVRMLPSPGPTS